MKSTAKKKITVEMNPSYAHILLVRLDLNSIFKFWSLVNEYSENNCMKLRASTLVSAKTRLTVMVRNRISNDRAFYSLSNKKLYKAIQKTVRPTTNDEFTRLLTVSLLWNDSGFSEDRERLCIDLFRKYGFSEDFQRLSIKSYPLFYSNVLTRTKEFEEKYVFLAHRNPTNEPEFEKIFLDSIPDSYGRNIFSTMTQGRDHSMKSFLRDFIDAAYEHYQSSMRIGELSPYVLRIPLAPIASEIEPSCSPSKSLIKRSGSNDDKYDPSPKPGDPIDYSDPFCRVIPDFESGYLATALPTDSEHSHNKLAKRLYASRELNAVFTPDSAKDPPSGGEA